MRLRRRAGLGFLLAFLLPVAPVRAQAAASISPAIEDALHAMTQSAAIIFSGQVIAIRRHEGVVEIDFAVEDAIRGVNGNIYTLREWGGLWDSGNEPLHVGQRYLMLLHAPGRGGLSSPVGGSDGAIPILGGADTRDAASSTEEVGRSVDLRWIETRLARKVEYAAEPQARPTSKTLRMQAETRTAQVNLTAGVPNATAAQSGASYVAVMGALRGWERDAAR